MMCLLKRQRNKRWLNCHHFNMHLYRTITELEKEKKYCEKKIEQYKERIEAVEIQMKLLMS